MVVGGGGVAAAAGCQVTITGAARANTPTSGRDNWPLPPPPPPATGIAVTLRTAFATRTANPPVDSLTYSIHDVPVMMVAYRVEPCFSLIRAEQEAERRVKRQAAWGTLVDGDTGAAVPCKPSRTGTPALVETDLTSTRPRASRKDAHGDANDARHFIDNAAHYIWQNSTALLRTKCRTLHGCALSVIH